jgi:hypothetical protein
MKTIRVGPGLALSSGPRGVSINLLPAQRARPATRRAIPFQVYSASDGATLKFGVSVGRVNLQIPTLGGVALDDPTPPTETITATTYVWLKCVGTFGSPDTYVVTVEATTSTTAPDPDSISGTGFVSCLPIAEITVASGAITDIRQLVFANLGVDSYGNINNWWALS